MARSQHIEIDANVRVEKTLFVERRLAAALYADKDDGFHFSLNSFLTVCVFNSLHSVHVGTQRFRDND